MGGRGSSQIGRRFGGVTGDAERKLCPLTWVPLLRTGRPAIRNDSTTMLTSVFALDDLCDSKLGLTAQAIKQVAVRDALNSAFR